MVGTGLDSGFHFWRLVISGGVFVKVTSEDCGRGVGRWRGGVGYDTLLLCPLPPISFCRTGN